MKGLLDRKLTGRRVQWCYLADVLVVELGCSLILRAKGGLPFRYLGCLLFKGRPTKRYFQHLLDKIQVSLSGWRGKFMSQGGRLILIRHVLSSIPVYTLATMTPPKLILQQIDRLFSRFFWGAGEEISR